MNFPENLKYTQDHEWILAEGNQVTVGITDFAQQELGDIVFVDVDGEGTVEAGEPFGSIEAVKTVSDLIAPCTIEVEEASDRFMTRQGERGDRCRTLSPIFLHTYRISSYGCNQ